MLGRSVTPEVVVVPLLSVVLDWSRRSLRAVSLDVSRLTAADAQLILKAPFLLWRQLVDPGLLKSVELQCVEGAVVWEDRFACRAIVALAVLAHGLEVVVTLKGL
jgi:hypothetical protein